MNSVNLITSMIFGAIGAGYLIYGKKQHHAAALLTGFLLCGLPCIIANFWVLSFLCLAAMALPLYL